MASLQHIDLTSGIGGFALGFEWSGLSKPVLFCDNEPWCRTILRKHWPDVPIAKDVKEIANEPDRFIPRTDRRQTILTSGYPCQPFSVAGLQRGSKMTATSGRTSLKLSHSKNPLGAFLKMFMVTSPWVSMRCCLTWKVKATPHNRLFYQLAQSARPTSETEYSSSANMWATPNTMDHLPQRSPEALERQKTTSRKSKEARQSARTSGRADDVYVGNARTTDGTGGARKLNEQGRRVSQTNPEQDYGANLATRSACGRPRQQTRTRRERRTGRCRDS